VRFAVATVPPRASMTSSADLRMRAVINPQDTELL
jgi:hypothetical protein